MNSMAVGVVRELDRFDAAADQFLLGCEHRFALVVGHNSESVSCTSCVTHYVIPGREFNLNDGADSLVFWVGLNGGRIFFISRFVGKPEELKAAFLFSFGGAAKIGWDFHYEPVTLEGHETSIWGTVDTGKALTEIVGERERSHELHPADRLTNDGCFWVNDIAMMLQSLLRTSQRHGIKNSSSSPAPL